MYSTELQGRLTRQKKWLQRMVALAVAILTFAAAFGLSLQAALTEKPESVVLRDTTPRKADQEVNDAEAGDRLKLTARETELMARAVYSEARGEQFQGQVAVAAVIFNRVEDPKFPDDIAGVIFEPLAFTAVADGQFWLEPGEQAYLAVKKALQGEDPSDGALYYYNPATASSQWIFSRRPIKRIGSHLFCE